MQSKKPLALILGDVTNSLHCLQNSLIRLTSYKQIANNDESSSSFETLCETVFFRAEKDDTAVNTGKEEIGAGKIIGVMGVERGASFAL